MAAVSTLVYSTWTGKQPEVAVEVEACLGSQGIISTAQCVKISLAVTGSECPVCVL